MAEVYGEKPKIFTKEWWPYFWLYYKWHTAAVIFVMLLVAVGISDCARKEKYDLKMTYLGRTYYETQIWEKAEKLLEEDINDADGNGDKNIGITDIVIVNSSEYAEQNYASYIKHDMSFSEDMQYVYIYEGTELDRVLEDGTFDGAFAKATEWLETDVAEDKLVFSGDEAYAVSLRDSTVLKKAGIDCEDLYIIVRADAGTPQNGDKVQENAVITANNLMK